MGLFLRNAVWRLFRGTFTTLLLGVYDLLLIRIRSFVWMAISAVWCWCFVIYDDTNPLHWVQTIPKDGYLLLIFYTGSLDCFLNRLRNRVLYGHVQRRIIYSWTDEPSRDDVKNLMGTLFWFLATPIVYVGFFIMTLPLGLVFWVVFFILVIMKIVAFISEYLKIISIALLVTTIIGLCAFVFFDNEVEALYVPLYTGLAGIATFTLSKILKKEHYERHYASVLRLFARMIEVPVERLPRQISSLDIY